MQQVTEINVAEPWFSAIRSGAKAVEGRLNKSKFAALKPGSVLSIGKSGPPGARKARPVVAVVSKVAKYASFEAYLAHEGLNRTLPGVHSIAEGIDVYRQFYSAEDERKHGIAAIHLALLA